MSVVFIDGFDHYSTTADMGTKWDVPGQGGFSAVNARTSGQAYFHQNSNSPKKWLAPSEQHATLIVGCAIKISSFGAIAGTYSILSFYGDSGTTQHITLAADTTGKLKVYRGSAGSTLLGQESGNSLTTGYCYVEMKVLLSGTVGTVEVRVNGVSVINLTAQNTKNGGTATVFDALFFVAGSNLMYIDDMYLCNGAGSSFNNFLGDVKVQVLYPSGAGANTGMTPSTGSNYAAVDDPQVNTTDYVSSSVAGTKDTYTYDDLLAGYDPLAVQVCVSAMKVAPGAMRKVCPVVRIGGVDYDGASQAVGAISYRFIRKMYTTNPATSAAWTKSDVNNAEFGVKVST